LHFSREHVALRLQNFAVNIVEAQFINSLADQDGNQTTLAKVLSASTLFPSARPRQPCSVLQPSASPSIRRRLK
jgi:hypothetical protein